MKFCFLLKFHLQQFSPLSKFQKFSFPPSFSFPLILKNFSSPRILLSSKIQSPRPPPPSPHPSRKRGGSRCDFSHKTEEFWFWKSLKCITIFYQKNDVRFECVLNMFTKLTGKHLCQSLFFNNAAILSKNIFFKEHLRANLSVSLIGPTHKIP